MDGIVSFLSNNAWNEKTAVTAKRLGDIFDLQDSTVRAEVANARKLGIPVCSCYYGYYIAHEEQGLKKTIESLQKRIDSQVETISALREILDRMMPE